MKREVFAFLVLALFAFAAAPQAQPALAQSPLQGGPLEILDQLGGAPTVAFVSGTTAFVGSGQRLVALNVSDLAHPQVLGRSPLLGGTVAKAPVLDGATAYVIAGKRLVALNVANPAAPAEVGSRDLPGLATELKLLNGRLYVYVSPDLLVYRIEAPGNLAYAGRVSAAGVTDLAAAGNILALVANGQLQVYSLANPDLPALRASLTLTNNATPPGSDWVSSLDLLPPYAYVASRKILHVVNASNPSAPVEQGRYTYPGTGMRGFMNIVADGPTNRIYAGGYGDGAVVVDITNRTAPTWVTNIATPLFTFEVSYANGVVYARDALSGLVLIELGVINWVRSSYDPLGVTMSVAAGGISAYTVENGVGFYVINRSNPANLTTSGFLSGAGYSEGIPVGMVYSGGKVFYASYSGLFVYDVTDPAFPTILEGFDPAPEGSYQDVTVDNLYAYAVWKRSGSTPTDGLDVVQISSLTKTGGQLALYQEPVRIAHDDSRLYILQAAVPGQGLQGGVRFATKAPGGPTSLGFYALPVGKDVGRGLAVRNSRVYFSQGCPSGVSSCGGFAVWVVDGNTQALLGTVPVSGSVTALAVDSQERYLYTLGSGGLCAYDINDLTAPGLIACLTASGNGMVMDGDEIYISGDGLLSVRATPQTQGAAGPGSGATLTLSGVAVNFGSAVFGVPVTLWLGMRSAAALPPLPGMSPGGQVYELTALDASQNPVQPQGSFAFTVQYADDPRIDESSIRLYYWDEVLARWVAEPTANVNTMTNTVSASPGHLSLWALAGEPAHPAYLPVALR